MQHYHLHIRMKIILKLYILMTLCAIPFYGMAQGQRMQNNNRGGNQSNRGSSSQNDSSEDEDPCIDIDDQRYCWTLDPITGIRYMQVPDTAYAGLANRQFMSSKSLGLIHTGNLYSPHYIVNTFDQKPQHDYLFVNAYGLFAYRPEDMVYYNTKIPYTNAGYYTSGSSIESNDHLRLDFAGNMNKKLGIGTFLDYVYARGEFESQATKPLKWSSYLYYLDDQYKATLTYNISKLANQENGGITDREYVKDPDSFKNDNLTTPRTMPVNLNNTWNDMDSWRLNFNHSYDLGFWEEDEILEEKLAESGDSTEVKEHFVSVASIFHSIDVESYKHQFRTEPGSDVSPDHKFFPNHYINKDFTLDSTAYMSFSTYAGIRLNEGFNKYSQFGLSAFIGYQHQVHTAMQDTLQLDFIDRKHTSDNLFVGGQLSRHLSNRLTFDITAKLGILGDKQKDLDVTGNLQTVIPAGKDSIILRGSGYFRNMNNSYMLDHYFGNHFKWKNQFKSEKRTRLQGNLYYSLTGTEAKIAVENLSNYHYFSADDYLPHESTNEIQVLSAEITQRLHWKALHFDNTVLLQTVTNANDEELHLPSFVWKTDLNLQFCIAHSLTTQLGATAQYYSKYYAPTYQPATQQFASQHEIECGDFPIVNAYINCNLKRIKFYIMYSGFGTKFFSNDVFLMPYYPMQSTRVEYGVVIDLQD